MAKKEVKRHFLLLRSQQYVKEKHIFFKQKITLLLTTTTQWFI